MSAKSVFCIAGSRSHAEAIVDHLQNSVFSNSDISVLFPDESTTRDFGHEKNTKAPDGIATGASAGGVVGGVLGLLAGMGAIVIPAVGPFIATSPILVALGMVAVAAAVGGIAGGLIGLGMPELEARHYEGKIKAGNILISVHAENAREVKAAETIFKVSAAQDICCTSERAPRKAKSVPAYS